MTGSAVVEVDGTGLEGGREAAPPHFLQRIAARLPQPAGPAAHARYLALLDRCLRDRAFSRHESDRLAAAAAELGIDRAAAGRLNRRTFAALVAVAREGGALTTGARAELAAVAALLRIDPARFEAAVAAAPRPPRRAAPVPG